MSSVNDMKLLANRIINEVINNLDTGISLSNNIKDLLKNEMEKFIDENYQNRLEKVFFIRDELRKEILKKIYEITGIKLIKTEIAIGSLTDGVYIYTKGRKNTIIDEKLIRLNTNGRSYTVTSYRGYKGKIGPEQIKPVKWQHYNHIFFNYKKY